MPWPAGHSKGPHTDGYKIPHVASFHLPEAVTTEEPYCEAQSSPAPLLFGSFAYQFA